MFASCKSLLLPRLAGAFASLLIMSAAAYAGVTVVQNVSPGATAWPGSPLYSTVSNPNGQLLVGEGFSGASNYTETFTVAGTSNYTLQSVCLYVGGGTGTSDMVPITLNLYDLGAQTAPNPNSYAAGFNLLGDGSGLPIAYTTQSNGVLQLNFTGDDQVYLAAGHLYAFEISGTSGTNPILWYRTTSDTYTGGAAYRGRSWLNGTNARDFGLAIYGAVNTNPPPPTSATISPATTYQQIDGFGAGAVFLDAGLDPLTDAWMDSLYGTGSNQMGLNLIRLRIAPTDTDWADQILDGQKAVARGVRILATPWTPPAAMKDSGSTIHGSLLPSHYADYVAYLNEFADTMRANGAPVSVISLQNEPDFDPTYEGCLWTADQLHTFSRDFASGITTPVIMPESFSYNHAMSDPTLNDSAAAANIDLIGGHLYGGTIQDYPLAHNLGKHTWMTEYLVNDQTIQQAVATGQQISDCLTVGNMSAYIWWKTIGDANGLLSASGVLQPRAYVMAQFSKFVSPGWVRIAVTANSSTLGISAFRNMDASRYTIVAVNNSNAAVNHKFTLQGLTPSSLTPVITSPTQSLAAQAPVTLSGTSFTYSIPASSIVTFTFTNTSPIAVKLGGYVLNRRTNQIVQQVTLTNTSSTNVSGPVRLVLDGLSSNTALANANGVSVYTPSGSSYVTVTTSGLAAGASVTAALDFIYTTSGISYSPRVAAGQITP
jgi:glucuronoarabinoxylan endo-1,4-beta-xylanase